MTVQCWWHCVCGRRVRSGVTQCGCRGLCECWVMEFWEEQCQVFDGGHVCIELLPSRHKTGNSLTLMA